MIRRVATAASLVPLVVLSVFYLPVFWFLLFVDVFLVLAVYEMFRLLEHYGLEPFRLTMVVTFLLPWVWIYYPGFLPSYFILSAFLCLGWSLVGPRSMKSGFLSASGNLLSVVYIGLPLSIGAAMQPARAFELFLILVVIWANDIAGLLVGRKWGRHRITPRLSPNKSLEGYTGGLAFSVLTAVIFGWYYLPDWTAGRLVGTGVALAMAGGVGDLFESMLKRGANVKDSSNLMPGHGGVLDRIDSLLFAFPVYYSLFLLLK